MRKLLLPVWLMLPVVLGAYHFGPGQKQLVLDDVSLLLGQADRNAADGEWNAAEMKYGEALKLIPAERMHQIRGVRLERAKARMRARNLPVAHRDLKALLDEMVQDRESDRELLCEVRSALANSQYYMTWLMRLEGLPREKWEPEIESARQTYRLLAEESERKNDKTAAWKHRQDLESTIRLARMDLGELQGLPLPSQ